MDHHQPAAATSYEQWVRALRAWGGDQTVSLAGLPPLTAETYDPATYARLITHLQRAVDAMMAGWQDCLSTSLARASDTHELGRELVALRSALARRVQLARHPGLPEPIRDILEKDAVRTFADLQQQLEEAVLERSPHGRLDTSENERLLAVVRRHPLTGALSLVEADTQMVAASLDIPGPAPESPRGLGSFFRPKTDEARAEAGPGVRPRRWAHRVVTPPTDRSDGGSDA